jgi:hypothetical protein
LDHQTSSGVINSLPLLAKRSADAIGSFAGMWELEPAADVGSAAVRRLWPYGLRAWQRPFPGVSHSVWSMDLRRCSALNRGAKSPWCVDIGEHWSDAGWLP